MAPSGDKAEFDRNLLETIRIVAEMRADTRLYRRSIAESRDAIGESWDAIKASLVPLP